MCRPAPSSRVHSGVLGTVCLDILKSTVAVKCETTLQSVKHFYEARDKFTFWKTFLPIIKHNYMGKTLLPRTKQIYILENKLTRRKTLLPVPKQIYNDRFFTERECTTHRK